MPIITPVIEELVLQASAKALASYNDGDINVVPVSTVKVVDDTIWLVDYFMEKTAANIKKNPQISLVCRKDMIGYQIKGIATYLSSGKLFDQACERIKPIHPDRIVKGLLVIKPAGVFDIAPGKDTAQEMKKTLQ